jgi:short-subunit dehydrogenase
MAVYCATKAYVLSFTEAISNEVKGQGITITALCPVQLKVDFKQQRPWVKVNW